MTKIDVKIVEGYKIVMEETTCVDVFKLVGFVALAFVSIFISSYLYIGEVRVAGEDFTIVVTLIVSLVGLMIVIGALMIFNQSIEKYFTYPAYTLSIEGTDLSITVPKISEQADKISVCNAVLSLESECRRLVKEKRDMQKIVWECK